MSPTYYVIELTPRWLTVLLLALAALMVLAFVGGYGAAWSVMGDGGEVAERAPQTGEAAVETKVVEASTGPEVVQSVATPVPAEPTIVPGPAQTPSPTPTPRPEPTPVPPKPTATATAHAVESAGAPFWVQVLASGNIQAIEKARRRLVEVGFPNANHKVSESRVAGGGVLLKLRVGPFPDRRSASRVMTRMQQSGFPDAWVVSP